MSGNKNPFVTPGITNDPFEETIASNNVLTSEDLRYPELALIGLEVCKNFNVKFTSVRNSGRGRTKDNITRARQVCMFFAKEFTLYTLKTIGVYFDKKDHASVIHSKKAIQNDCKTIPSFRKRIDDLRITIKEKLEKKGLQISVSKNGDTKIRIFLGNSFNYGSFLNLYKRLEEMNLSDDCKIVVL